MPYDLIIRNGTIIDGSGLPRFRADVGIMHGKIATIGKIRERAKEVIDADGHVVAPGFIDGHTHIGRFHMGIANHRPADINAPDFRIWKTPLH